MISEIIDFVLILGLLSPNNHINICITGDAKKYKIVNINISNLSLV